MANKKRTSRPRGAEDLFAGMQDLADAGFQRSGPLCSIMGSDPTGDWTVIGDRRVPEGFEIAVAGDPTRPSVYCRIEVVDGAPRVTEVRLMSRDGEGEVRQSDLKGTNLAKFLELFSLTAIPDNGEDPLLDHVGGPVSDDPSITDDDWYDEAIRVVMTARRSNRRITDELLEQVADVYRANIRHNPTKAVRGRFLVSERTASQYVRLARDAGLLPETTPGKKRA